MNKISRSIFNTFRLNNLLNQQFGYYDNIKLESTAGSFKASDVSIKENKNKTPKPKVWDPSKLPFGKVPTDYMLIMDWELKTGWKKPQIVPFGFMNIHPFTSSLHYGI